MLWHSFARRINNAYRRSPTFLLITWFTVLILLGSLFLALPVSHLSGKQTSFLTALFTATSAACVTGLSLVDVAETYSFFGQLIILLLIEFGGIGVVTFANLGFSLLRKRMSLSQQVALADSLFQNDAAMEFRRIFSRMVKTVSAIQIVGFAALFCYAVATQGARQDLLFNLWSALFHSISAFCNAGLSIYHSNLEPMRKETGYLAIIALLIILGGLGHHVLVEVGGLSRILRKKEKKAKWFSLNTRVVLVVTGIILILGAISMWLSGDGVGDSWTSAIFHSISARTAGFNILPLNKLPLTSCLILCLLMFVGGSPGSCAGGVKTTSLAIWLARIKANLQNDSNVHLFGYTIAPDLVSRARILMALSVLWNLVGVILLSIVQPGVDLDVLLFEQISAFAPVGLSMGLTPELANVSQLWIILSMFIGRLGPLTVILWAVPHTKAKVGYPIGRVMVG